MLRVKTPFSNRFLLISWAISLFFSWAEIFSSFNHLSVSKLKIYSFEIGSVTKQFTAAAILRLIDEVKLSLEDDFTEYLNFDAKGRTVTINHLFNHTSGIPNYTELPEIENLSIQKTDYYKMTYFVY